MKKEPIKKDPAIEEIRAVRRKISRKFGDDSKALVAHYMELQSKQARRLKVGKVSDVTSQSKTL